MVWLPPTVNTSTIYNRWKFNRRGRLIKSINKPPSKTTSARLQNGGSCLSVFVCEETGAVFFFFLFTRFRRTQGYRIKVCCLRGIMEEVYPEYIYSPESWTCLKLDVESTQNPWSQAGSFPKFKFIKVQLRASAWGPPLVNTNPFINSLVLFKDANNNIFKAQGFSMFVMWSVIYVVYWLIRF